jgi:hypothetical protein
MRHPDDDILAFAEAAGNVRRKRDATTACHDSLKLDGRVWTLHAERRGDYGFPRTAARCRPNARCAADALRVDFLFVTLADLDALV